MHRHAHRGVRGRVYRFVQRRVYRLVSGWSAEYIDTLLAEELQHIHSDASAVGSDEAAHDPAAGFDGDAPMSSLQDDISCSNLTLFRYHPPVGQRLDSVHCPHHSVLCCSLCVWLCNVVMFCEVDVYCWSMFLVRQLCLHAVW